MDLDSYLTMNRTRRNTYAESKRKLLSLELARRKRNEINDLVNKELRIKQGAANLLKVCQNEHTKERLRLELAFVDSNIRYLKDQLAELNCNWTLYKMKNITGPVRQTPVREDDTIRSGPMHQYCLQPAAVASMSSSSSSSSSSSGSRMARITSTPNRHEHNTHPAVVYLKPYDPILANSSNTNSPSSDSVKKNNEYSFSPSSSSSISVQTNVNTVSSSSSSASSGCGNHKNFVYVKSPPNINSNPVYGYNCHDGMTELEMTRVGESCRPPLGDRRIYQQFSLDESQTKSADIMVYINLKETLNNIDFSNGFSQFIIQHYRDNPAKYFEQMRQFNYFRESTIRLSYEPSHESLTRLFEYFNSLVLIERRFFQNSQCKHVYFTWYDSINGVESTQKSIQFEKAAILFNCATLFTQLAAIWCDGHHSHKVMNDQLAYWLQAAGCINYLNTNFSNSPSLDMSNYVLSFFTDVFLCQAYEIKAKLLLLTNSNDCDAFDPKNIFVTYNKCSRLYSFISEKYSEVSLKLSSNQPMKNYLPEIWYHLIKVKSTYYKGLSHYYASLAISTTGLERVWDNLEVESLFDDLHDRSKLSSSLLFSSSGPSLSQYHQSSYFQKQIYEQNLLYDYSILRCEKRILLAKAHMRECIVWQEEAIRQHGFCRKFTKDDYLHNLLRYYHDIALDKFMQFENQISNELNDELFDLLPINSKLNDRLVLKTIEPNFQKYEAKDFFNLIGPLKIYSSEIELSVPFSCILRKLPYQQTFGVTVKGDCPVRINQVDKQSYAYSAGIREGDFIVAIQDQDVRWSKHAQVVERIRSNVNSVKLTLVSPRPVAREPAPPVYPTEDSTTNKPPQTPIKTPKLHQRLFRLPNSTDSTPHLATPHLTPDLSFSNAANRLANLVKQQTNDWTKSAFKRTGSSSKSMQNLPEAIIQFNEEDDEISSRENQLFWQSLKNLKVPFTNTITLGRKFRKNVLKLSIFNSFSNSGADHTSKSESNKDNLSSMDEPAGSLPPPTPNSKRAKIRLLRKQKKLNKLEAQQLSDSTQQPDSNLLLYKTI